MTRPFSDKTFTFTNPDGTEITVRGWGDQYYAVFETLDGFTVIKDPETGFYQYAHLSEDKNDLLPTGAKVGDVDPRNLGLIPHIRVRRDAARKKALSARGPGEPPRRWEIRRNQKKALVSSPFRVAEPGMAPPSGTTVGDYVGLCLLIEFPDVASTILQQEVDNFCNQQGYNGFGNNGSVRDYFHDVSDGRLHYTNVVTAYYRAAHDRSYYTDPLIAYGTRARELIVEALDDLVAQGFDFSQLSSDSGGYIYALNVFYAGPTVNNWAEGLWPHSSSLASAYQAAPGKILFDYQITDMGNQLTLGTFCYENGHMICDFPDLYDYGYESLGAGNYCLMAFGGNDDRNPVQVGAYLKNEAGWTTRLTPITSGMTARITAGQNDFYIYTKNQTEYFIVENRQQQGRDASLPDAGLTIWHIDELGSNNNEQMTSGSHYECSLEQADNRFDLELRANAGDGDDLFASPYNARFADDTNPNSRWWDGSVSGLAISEISASGPVMTFSTSRTAALYRYWNGDAADHFYTTNWSELGSGNYGWVYEGIQCYVYPSQDAGTIPLYRYWNGDAADHFYTTNWNELGSGNYGWVYEGIQCYVFAQPMTALGEDVPATFRTRAASALLTAIPATFTYKISARAQEFGAHGHAVPATFRTKGASNVPTGTPATFTYKAGREAQDSRGKRDEPSASITVYIDKRV